MGDDRVRTPLDQATADRLSAGFHRCFEAFEADEDVFAPDTLFDLMPPLWRFQVEGPDAFVGQLRSIAEGPVTVDVLHTTPTSTGFVTEHVETQRTADGEMTARRVHLCTVEGGRITAATTYCNGGWDAALRARHAAEAPMVRP
jgi:ketosteroid isomerase-like protein